VDSVGKFRVRVYDSRKHILFSGGYTLSVWVLYLIFHVGLYARFSRDDGIIQNHRLCKESP
jgi:hypothetical protein